MPPLYLILFPGVTTENYLNSEAGNFDRVVIQELLKEIAQTQQVDLNAKQRFKGAHLLALLIDVFSLMLFLSHCNCGTINPMLKS